MIPVSAEDRVANIVLPLGPERAASGDSLSPGTDTSALMFKAAKRAQVKMKQRSMCRSAPLARELGAGSTGGMQWANTTNHQQRRQGSAGLIAKVDQTGPTLPQFECVSAPVFSRRKITHIVLLSWDTFFDDSARVAAGRIEGTFRDQLK